MYAAFKSVEGDNSPAFTCLWFTIVLGDFPIVLWMKEESSYNVIKTKTYTLFNISINEHYYYYLLMETWDW